MTRLCITLTALAVLSGCGGTVTLGEKNGKDGLGAGSETDTGTSVDTGSSADTAPIDAEGFGADVSSADTGSALDAGPPSGIAPHFHVSDGIGGVESTIDVFGDCRVFRNGAFLGTSSAADCTEFWAAVDDSTGDPPPCSAGSPFTLTLTDATGVVYTKTEVDFCLAKLPGRAAHKGAYVLVYRLGGK